MLELTVFIRVKIESLNEFSKSIPKIVKIDVKINKENTKIKSEIKYLFISLVSILVSEKSNLFIKTFSGLACEISSFNENLNNE